MREQRARLSVRIQMTFRVAFATAALMVTTSASAFAQASWEVAVIFLGSRAPGETPSEALEFQRDIDRNMLELARVSPGPRLKLSILREYDDRAVQYFPNPSSRVLSDWEPLFAEPPVKGVRVPGKMKIASPSHGRLSQEFLARAFPTSVEEPSPSTRRMLVIYGHGLGYQGFQEIRLKELRGQLERFLPTRGAGQKPLDILWLDACFMATLEVAYELRGLSSLMMASQDSEFSSGALFDALNELGQGPEDAASVAIELAETFVESYSYLKNGRQRHAAYKSAATISVIDTARVESLVRTLATLAQAIGKLSPEQRKSLRRGLGRRAMEKPELADLGSVLRSLSRLKSLPEAAHPPLAEALRQLEIDRPGRLKTHPRIRLLPPADTPGAFLVYGYENWRRGHEADAETLGKLPSALSPGSFVPGPQGLRWPAREIRKRLVLSPFAVGLNRFDAYFADPSSLRPLSEPKSFTRTSDYVTFTSRLASNPVLYSGYTQGAGNVAERYTGLAILDPALRAAGVDYIDLEFAATGWGWL